MKPVSRAAVMTLCLLTVISSCGGKKEESGQSGSVAAERNSPFKESQPKSKRDLLAAEWRGGKIYLSQIDNILGGGFSQLIQNATDEEKIQKVLTEKRRDVLETLVENYILIQEAHARNLQLSESQMERLLKDARGKFDTREEYEESLRSAGQTEEEFIKILANIQLGQLCVEDQSKKLGDTISPKTLREYYDTHIADRFTPPARTDINWVVIKPNEQRNIEEAKALAERLHKEVMQKSEGLTKLADKRKVIQECAFEHSDDFSGKYNYGYRNFYHRGEGWDQLDSEFRDEIGKRKVGEFSRVVKIDRESYGFFLVYNSISSMVSPFDSPGVQKMLPNLFLHEELEKWRKQIRDDYELKIYDENLATVPDDDSFIKIP